jgi:hypothetical protein
MCNKWRGVSKRSWDWAGYIEGVGKCELHFNTEIYRLCLILVLGKGNRRFSSEGGKDKSYTHTHTHTLRAEWSGVQVPARARNFTLHNHVQNSSGTHPASYPMFTRVSFPGVKPARAWSWPFTSI